jgi:hypothetical protein
VKSIDLSQFRTLCITIERHDCWAFGESCEIKIVLAMVVIQGATPYQNTYILTSRLVSSTLSIPYFLVTTSCYGPPRSSFRCHESSPKRGRPCLADRRRNVTATPERPPAVRPLTLPYSVAVRCVIGGVPSVAGFALNNFHYARTEHLSFF